MSLPTGTPLGPYQIVGLLGAGGMGEVYRARDTRLDRTVAIKVLPPAVAADPDRRARFEREARAISQLTHPHVCTLFDVGREGDTDYLVMEYLEGETLAQRLARVAARTPVSGPPTPATPTPSGTAAAELGRARAGRPLPFADTLRIGTELAEALAAAHRAGIVHRDLKPGNVMLTPSGVKVLDFGLAKLRAAAPAADAAAATRTADALTDAGTRLGTIPYMAPEQVEGKEADARSDLFALGGILYEMATGRRAFEGETAASVAAAILDREPEPVTALQPLTPPAFEHVVATCLAKDPEARWQAASDVARELHWIAASSAESISPVVSATSVGRRRERLAWVVASVMAVGALAAGAFALWHGDRVAAGDVTVHAAVLHDGGGVIDAAPSNVAISPDGRRIAYIVVDEADESADEGGLWVRDLDSQTSRRLSDLWAPQFPFWSPDGRWVAFFTMGDPRRLWKVPAAGGAPVSLCAVTACAGGTWGKGDVIVIASTPGGPLYRVPAAPGGSPEPVTVLDSKRHQTGHRMPWFLPDGDHFLFAALPRVGPDVEIFAGSLGSKQVKRIMAAASGVTYAEPGYLLFERDQKLVAQRFEPSRLELTGEPVPIGDPPLAESLWEASWIATASADGRLASLRSWPQRTEVEWVDRFGRVLGKVPLPIGGWQGLALAPNGQSVLASRPIAGTVSEAWHFDVKGVKVERVCQPQIMNSDLAWSPDGRSFVWSSSQGGRFEIYRQQLDNTGAPQMVPTVDAQFKTVCSFTPDGRALVIAAVNPLRGWELWMVPLGTKGAPTLLLPIRTRKEMAATVSPDGRWLAYLSLEAGQSEVYVTSFPPGGQRTRVSTSGGWDPKWVRDGKELLYLSRQGRDFSVMSVPVGTGPVVAVGVPRVVLTRRGLSSFAVTSDGERLLLSVESGDTPPPYISLTLNWTAAMRGR